VGGKGYRSPCGDRGDRAEGLGWWDMHYMESRPFESRDSSEESPFYRYALEAAGDGCRDGLDTNHGCSFRPDQLSDKAMEFMEDHMRLHGATNPMFLYYSTPGVRSAGSISDSHPPESYRAQCGHFTNLERRDFCAGVATVDAAIGRVVDRLHEWSTNFGQEFVAIIASDNGGSTHLQRAGANNWPLRGNKNEVFEGGIRTKALVYGKYSDFPVYEQLQVYDSGLVHLMDWHMLIAELGGYMGPVNARVPDHQRFEQDEGQPFMWRALISNSPFRKKAVGNAKNLRFFALDWPYKVVWSDRGGNSPPLNANEGAWWPPRTGDTENFFSTAVLRNTDVAGPWLFNLEEDPFERENLYDATSAWMMDLFTQTQSSFFVDHWESASDYQTCAITGQDCLGDNPDQIDALRISSNPQIQEACDSQRTVAPYYCLSDRQWCPTTNPMQAMNVIGGEAPDASDVIVSGSRSRGLVLWTQGLCLALVGIMQNNMNSLNV